MNAPDEERRRGGPSRPNRDASNDRRIAIVAGHQSDVDLATGDAERALLTCMMLQPASIASVAALVDVANFAHPDRAAVFAALLEHEGAVDFLSLQDALRRAGSRIADDVIGLGELVDAPGVMSGCHERHAAAVVDYARRRRAIEIGAVLQDDARDLTRPIEHSIAGARVELDAIGGAP